VQFHFTEKLPSLANLSLSWQKKYQVFKEFRLTAYWAILKKKKEILSFKMPITIKLIRLGPRELDSDNLVYAFKPIRDGIAEALWPEKKRSIQDSHEDVIWDYGQEKSKTLSWRIDISEGSKRGQEK
jgi:hypothetical protein